MEETTRRRDFKEKKAIKLEDHLWLTRKGNEYDKD